MVDSLLLYQEIFIQFFIAVIPFYISTDSVQGFQISHNLANTYAFLKIITVQTGVKGAIIVLICIFVTINDVVHPLIYLLATYMSFMEKCLIDTENYTTDEIN